VRLLTDDSEKIYIAHLGQTIGAGPCSTAAPPSRSARQDGEADNQELRETGGIAPNYSDRASTISFRLLVGFDTL